MEDDVGLNVVTHNPCVIFLLFYISFLFFLPSHILTDSSKTPVDTCLLSVCVCETRGYQTRTHQCMSYRKNKMKLKFDEIVVVVVVND